MSKALTFASTDPQYDDRLFIELQVQYLKIQSWENMLCTEIVSYIQNNFCTQHFLPVFCKKKSFWQRFICTKNQNYMTFSKLHIRGFLEVSPGILCAQSSISLRLLTGPRGRDLLRYNVLCISAPTITGNSYFFQYLSYQDFFQCILLKSDPMCLQK